MQYLNIFFVALLALPQAYAQQAADGLIVPFTSQLPICASKCGPLYDVQGGCTPPVKATNDASCFCSDSRLSAFANAGTAGVSSVCGATACTSPTDLEAVKSWYQKFCANRASPSTTAGGKGTTSTGTPRPTSGTGGSNNASSDNNNGSWISTHYQYVIMAVVIVIVIVVAWVGAWFLRKRYLRKREREIEMNPPVAGWGPNQTQTAPGGYTYGDGIVDANGSGASGAGGHHKEAAGIATHPNGRLKKQKMGWFKSTKD